RIGESLAEPELVKEAQAIMDMMQARGAEVPLPVDVVVADEVSMLARANRISVCDVGPHDRILDVGPKSAAKLAEIIAHAGTIVGAPPCAARARPRRAPPHHRRPPARRARARAPPPAGGHLRRARGGRGGRPPPLRPRSAVARPAPPIHEHEEPQNLPI